MLNSSWGGQIEQIKQFPSLWNWICWAYPGDKVTGQCESPGAWAGLLVPSKRITEGVPESPTGRGIFLHRVRRGLKEYGFAGPPRGMRPFVDVIRRSTGGLAIPQIPQIPVADRFEDE